MSRKTKADYEGPGSFARIVEAGIALAETDSDDDAEWHARQMRMRSALNGYAPRVLGAKGGRARAAKLTPEERSEAARRAIKARWAKVRAATNGLETKPDDKSTVDQG